MTDSQDSPLQRRAITACQFCRRRKIKCNNEQPRCGNCRTYGKQCVYTHASRPRKSPTVRRETTPVQAEIQVRSGSPELSESRRTHLITPNVGIDGPGSATTASSTQYYGPTSAHFEERTSQSARRRLPHDLAQKVLMAEAAHERQMEAINYAAAKFDFDGEDPELGLHLLSIHWNRQHHSFLVTYRPAFMRDMASGGKYFSKLLLNAIYFGAAKFSSRLELRSNPDDVRTSGWKYRRRVKELLGSALDRSDITTIQALLVMTNSLFALGDERSSAWLYAGIAFRMIVDLGIHVDRSLSFDAAGPSEEDLEISRRVFWGAFVIDKIQSLYQGRPPSLQDFDIRVPILFNDRYEELEHWTSFAFPGSTDYPGSPAYSVSTFTELCKLSVIMNKIINRLYAEKSANGAPEILSEDRKKLQEDLEAWSRSLPAHLAYDPGQGGTVPPPHVISLQAMYNVLLILLNRPFVSDGQLYSHSQAIVAEAFHICSTAATKIVHFLEAYDREFSIKRAPYLISYATYVGATIHVRIAAQCSAGSDAHASLATCLAVLEKNQETNWAVRKQRNVIIDLAARMGVILSGQAVCSPDLDNRSGQNPTITGIDHRSPINARQTTAKAAPLVGSSLNMNDPSISDTPSLDMDAIIQSFTRVHGVPGPEGYHGQLPSVQTNDFGTLSYGTQPNGWLGFQCSPETPFASYFFSGDTLFGFNGEYGGS